MLCGGVANRGMRSRDAATESRHVYPSLACYHTPLEGGRRLAHGGNVCGRPNVGAQHKILGDAAVEALKVFAGGGLRLVDLARQRLQLLRHLPPPLVLQGLYRLVVELKVHLLRGGRKEEGVVRGEG